jgi:hypothetical protein
MSMPTPTLSPVAVVAVVVVVVESRLGDPAEWVLSEILKI